MSGLAHDEALAVAIETETRAQDIYKHLSRRLPPAVTIEGRQSIGSPLLHEDPPQSWRGPLTQATAEAKRQLEHRLARAVSRRGAARPIELILEALQARYDIESAAAGARRASVEAQISLHRERVIVVRAAVPDDDRATSVGALVSLARELANPKRALRGARRFMAAVETSATLNDVPWQRAWSAWSEGERRKALMSATEEIIIELRETMVMLRAQAAPAGDALRRSRPRTTAASNPGAVDDDHFLRVQPPDVLLEPILGRHPAPELPDDVLVVLKDAGAAGIDEHLGVIADREALRVVEALTLPELLASIGQDLDRAGLGILSAHDGDPLLHEAGFFSAQITELVGGAPSPIWDAHEGVSPPLAINGSPFAGFIRIDHPRDLERDPDSLRGATIIPPELAPAIRKPPSDASRTRKRGETQRRSAAVTTDVAATVSDGGSPNGVVPADLA